MSPSAGSISWKSLPRSASSALSLIRRTAPREYAILVVASLVSSAGLLILMLAGRELLQQLSGDEGVAALGSLWPALIGLAFATTLLSAAAAVQGEIRWLMAYLIERATISGVVDATAAVPLAELESPEFQDHLQRTLEQAAHRPWEIAEAMAQLMGAIAGGVVIAALLMTIEPWLVPAILVAAVPVVVAAGRNSTAMFDALGAITPVNRERHYLQAVLTGRDEAKEVRAFGSGAYLRGRYEDRYEREIAGIRVVSRLRARRSFLAGMGATAVTLGVLVLLIALTINGRLTLADAAIGAVAVQQLGARVRGIGGSITSIHEASLFLRDYDDFVGRAARAHRTVDRTASIANHSSGMPDTALELDDVWFTYPGASGPALKGVSLSLRQGTVTALVGANGSGKTTIAKLVCQLYEPQAGTLRWSPSLLDADGGAPRVGVIFQDFIRYQFDAHDNIGLGDAERIDDERAVTASAQAAKADTFLSKLILGYRTWLSPAFDGGIDLSVGQWQRVAMARAIFRDAPVVVMDEPTASLDPAAERDLIASTSELFGDKAVLVISHRFANVVAADRILVLDDGHVIEEGTHTELMALDGAYAEMYALQAETFGVNIND